MMKQDIAPFIHPQMLKKHLLRVILMMYLNQSIVRLYKTYKISFRKGLGGIIDSVVDHNVTAILK